MDEAKKTDETAENAENIETPAENEAAAEEKKEEAASEIETTEETPATDEAKPATEESQSEEAKEEGPVTDGDKEESPLPGDGQAAGEEAVPAGNKAEAADESAAAKPEKKEAEEEKKDEKRFSDIRPGMTVRVHQKIKEVTAKGEKERIQVFEGMVLARKGGDEIGATITVRKVSGGIGVEKTFPIYSPNVVKIEAIKQAKVRRAKLFFLRTFKKKLKEKKI